MNPTPEQVEARRLFAEGDSLVVEAAAGAGKTSTLRLMAESTDRRGRYLAFNKSIVEDSKGKFPETVFCSTAHSMAFRPVGSRFAHRLRGGRMRPSDLADRLGIYGMTVDVGGKPRSLASGWLAGLVMGTVTKFCQSDEPEPAAHHVRYIDGIDPVDDDGRRTWDNNNRLREFVVPFARKAWADLCDPEGQLPYGHHAYLKLAQLEGIHLPVDYILFDEAQDVAPVVDAIVRAQDHAQRIYVGDANQAIYGWAGAVDALTKFVAANRTRLTMSFRFGPEIAEVANRALAHLATDMRVSGLPSLDSVVGPVPSPHAVLSRTNAAAVEAVFTYLAAGRKPHLIGGGKEVTSFARAAQDLKAGRRTSHPDLACFESWGEVQDYVAEDEMGDELRLMVRLVDDFGPERIVAALDRMPSEERADVVVSTAHKAKGREWESVKLTGDFPNPEQRTVTPDEWRLLYVAVTRAKRALDVSAVGAFANPAPVTVAR